MKTLAFLWWWDRAKWAFPRWHDGLKAALNEIGKTHKVDIYLGENIPTEAYDATLFWGDSNCSIFNQIDRIKGKKGIILTTDPHNIENLKKLDVVFCESNPVYEEVRKHGLHAVKAFGTDVDFFSPEPTVKKDIGYFYPATFSPWKRQSEIAYLGSKLWCVGTVQPDGQKELEACRKTGVNIATGYFWAKHIRNLYRRAKRVIIPAIHGSERTVLEAMSCDIEPIITHGENRRTYSYIKEYKTWCLENPNYQSPRNFIIKNYNFTKYAQDILKGFEI